jgi:hypothetical protein
VRLVKFSNYDPDSDAHGQLFTFCINSFKAHGPGASLIFKTMDASRLTTDEWRRLASLDNFLWCFLNGSVARTIIELRDQLQQNQNEIEELRNLLQQAQPRNQDRGHQSHEKGDLPDKLGSQAEAREAQEGQPAPDRQQEELARLQGRPEQRGREVVHPEQASVEAGTQFPPATDQADDSQGIIARLTQQCGGNVHARGVVVVTSSEPDNKWIRPQIITDLASTWAFVSASHRSGDEIPHTRNSFICYEFKTVTVVPTGYAIRSVSAGPGGSHLKSWLVETSIDGLAWKEVDHKEDNAELNDTTVTRRFAITGGEKCRFIRLVNIGRNHNGTDQLALQAWEIFGSLIE